MERAASSSFRTEGDAKAGAELSSCFVAPKESLLYWLRLVVAVRIYTPWQSNDHSSKCQPSRTA
jgi:hypothetical protein